MTRLASPGFGFACLWSLVVATGCQRSAAPVPLPEPSVAEAAPTGDLRTAVLAGGCFWGVEAVFERVEGVTEVVSGYAGGSLDDPSYEAVSSGRSGHAESILVTYDPSRVSFGTLLRVFFSVAHDPTELNRQGPDIGTQYRSAIFFANEDQERIARAYVSELEAAEAFSSPIATVIEPLDRFYPAEAYHQDYFELHPNQPYIVMFDRPKVAGLREHFPELFRERVSPVAGG